MVHDVARLLGRRGGTRGFGEHVTETQRQLMDTHLAALHRHTMPSYDGATLLVVSRSGRRQRPLREWYSVLTGPATEVLVDASHMDMWRGEHAPRMARLLLDHVTAAFERDAAPEARSA